MLPMLTYTNSDYGLIRRAKIHIVAVSVFFFKYLRINELIVYKTQIGRPSKHFISFFIIQIFRLNIITFRKKRYNA